MKRLSRIFLIIMFVFTFILGCTKKDSEYEEPKKETTNPLFYKINDSNSNTNIYLLGSIHAADDTAYPLSEIIMQAYNDSEYLAVEVDTVALTNDFEVSLQLAQKMLYTDGTTIKDHLGDEMYNKMIEILNEKILYNSLYDNYKPAFFESLLENAIIKDANMDANKGIDLYFLNLAKENEKNILEIETAEFQYNLLLNNPIELDRMLIDSYIDNYDESLEEMKKMYEAWKNGNQTVLEQLMFSEEVENLTVDQISLLENYNKRLITDRNYGMVNTLEQYIKEEKNVFCVVGVGHVIGDEGIVSLMQKKGYNVEQLN